jgi:phosphoglucomutase
VRDYDYIASYVADLENVIDMELIARAKLKIGVDPLGGASLDFWDYIGQRYGIALEVVNREIDPAFSFMPLDHDGRIRMDCSSPYAMAGLIRLKDKFDISFANDADADRHGIVTSPRGLMNSNHFLAVAIDYLYKNRPHWRKDAGIGKTIVSTSMIDRVAAALDRPLMETPVGFKWFVRGLLDGSCGFGGEESAGASFLRMDGCPWTTDKDGLVMDLLACEIMAKTGKNPARIYGELEDKLGASSYARIDTAVTAEQKSVLKKLSPEMITAASLGGEPIVGVLTRAPANNADIGGVKVVSPSGWFALRPSGTEDVYKIYVESFKGEKHRRELEKEAAIIVKQIFTDAGV